MTAGAVVEEVEGEGENKIFAKNGKDFFVFVKFYNKYK